MFTHRTATPGAPGSNTASASMRTFSFFQNVRLDGYLAGTRTRRRDGDDLSYRGFFDYNADRYGVQVERLEVQPNFLPEIGFLRRTDMRRNFGPARFSPRPARSRTCAVHDAGHLNYVTNDRQPPRHARAGRAAARPSSPTATSRRHLHRHLRAAGAALCHRAGRSHPGRQLRLPQPAAVLHRRAAAPLLGPVVYEAGHVLQRPAPVDRGEHGARWR